MTRRLAGALLLLLVAGCSTRERAPVAVEVTSFGPAAVQQLRNDDTGGAAVSSAVASGQVSPQGSGNPLAEAVAQMASQLAVGLRENRIRRLPMAVLPFADLGRIRKDTQHNPVGEKVAEDFIYQLQRKQFNLVDYRAVSLNTTEKPPLTRQYLSALYSRYHIYFVLTGTYSRYPDGLVLNARVLDTTTRQVLASAQAQVPDSRLEGMHPGYDPERALEAGMIIENANGPVGP